MRRFKIGLAVLLASGLLLWEFLPVQVTVWDGGFDLAVRVTHSSPVPIRAVSCHAVGTPESASSTLETLLPPGPQSWSAVADPFTGQVLTVEVPVSGRDSPVGRELKRSQFRYLVVIAEFQDSKKSGKVVDIPDSRVSRSVTVNFP